MAETAYAHLKSNLELTFKYHIAIAFSHIRLLRADFALVLILLQKQGFGHFDLYSKYTFEASEIILGAE